MDMSLTSKSDVYVVSRETIAKPIFMENELEQCTVWLNHESIGESPIVKEQLVTNGQSEDKVDHHTEATIYFEQTADLDSCDNESNDFESSSAAVSKADSIKDCDLTDVDAFTSKENEEEEEETIATFVTASGQQLALYAVENSDEIFAVTVYDESGEPPSNFQFLMKADVERLIGEGAVRTVKKPSQMKKRVLTAHPPMFYREEEFEEENDRTSCDTSINTEQLDECQDDLDSEEELMERSTVQYIFLEGDHQSDSELTFDEIQATLQNMKNSRKRTSEKNDKKFNKSQNDHSSNSQENFSKKIELSNEVGDELEFRMSPQSTTDRTCFSGSENDRQRLIDTLTDSSPSTTLQTPLKVKRSRKQQLISVDRDDGEIIIQPASMLNEDMADKKRTRRRQLHSQLRDTMAKRIKETKRIKRKKRRKVVEVIDLDMDEDEQQTRRNVVEITLDDSKDKYSSDKENEIIMVTDSENGDDEEEEEEEEEDEWQPGRLTKLNGAIRCKYCPRKFRYRRTLSMHLLVCQKSPKSKDENQRVKKQYTCKICQEKFDEVVALARHARAMHSQRKKHRLNLSPAKSPSKSLRSVQQKETSLTEEEESVDDNSITKRELRTLVKVKRKRKQKNRSLEANKLNCADCGRWFPSTALLNAHSLHHGTKKSEQLHKCHICKKLIKSRLMFLQHLKMHNDAQRNSGSSSRILRRKLRARPSTRKITSPRKRGRPRKF
ncbi:myb-like protein X isoform X4 [Pogonomyrmex barbatus]|uniref:Myb-like protein X isoform X4 n=1 Tax=Pogonomyrmex barbatus TaxID=144034 RepID=A0A6I9W2E7_9HYME|nr:myb-like protein X isoform X4 [Pogonomyrmex barbatus]